MFTKAVVAHFGTQQKVADALGISKQAVSRWHKQKVVPRGAAYQIQVLTAGKLQVDPSAYGPKKKPVCASELHA